MAEFTDKDKELLDKLRKAFESKGKTREALEPWEEHLSRDASLNANKAGLAAKIVEGFSGSWAAQYHFGWGSLVGEGGAPATTPFIDEDPEGPPVPIHAKTSKIGKRGFPELNFAPYNWRTNTFGSKGPSLVGHPISFEVVGPTLKSPFCDWTWDVSQGAGPNGGDLLTPSIRPDGGVSPLVNEISDMYGPGINGTWTIGDAAEPNGGLYLLVSDDGANAGALAGGQTPMGALPNFVDTARYELFRISEILDFSIEIHPNKSFGTHFDLPLGNTRNIRAVTIVKPFVTRLQAIPQSGAAGGNDGVSTYGREQTFVVVSPERAAGNDNFPPYQGAGGAGAGDGSWLGGGFTESRAPGSSLLTGAPSVYGAAVRLPIPNPVLEIVGSVTQAFAVLPTDPVGQWSVVTGGAVSAFTAAPFSPTNLPVVRISSTTRRADFPPLAFGSVESCMGWFDVFATGASDITLERVPETDPLTGLTYWGPGPYVSSISGTTSLDVGMTLHESIDNLWLNPVFQLDKVEASRLRNLIDPVWVERFEKQISDPLLAAGQAPPPGGSGPGRPDKAIFDTRRFFGAGPIPEAADPGNLMNLGFRMVLFPAKEDPNDVTQTIPDFDHPITGRELVIDGSVNEKQFVEVDYSSGIVRLSIPPPLSRADIPEEETDVIPNGITGAGGNNLRGEVVLFGACVPYSMEDSQVGTGARVTTHTGDGRDIDVTSDQVSATINSRDTVYLPATPPFFGVSGLTGAVDIVLDRFWEGPETGVISIASGNDDSPIFGNWGYTQKTAVDIDPGPGTKIVTALGGLSSNPAALDPTPATPEEPRSTILRREVVFGEQSIDLARLTDFYTNDTTYGSSLRADTLRFKDAVSHFNMDGSTTVEMRTPGYMWNQQGQWTSSGIVQLPAGPERRISDTGILAGVFYQRDDGTPVTNAASDGLTSVDLNGQYIEFTSSGAAGYSGAVTKKSLIMLRHNFRLVVKFRLNGDATPTVNQFIGLIGPAELTLPDPAVSLVFNAAVTPPTPSFSYLGLRFDGPFPGTPATFFAQNLLSPGSALTHGVGAPWSQFQNTTHYLVIETEPYFDFGIPPGAFPGNGDYVKMAVFDAQFNEVGSTRFYDQAAVPYDTTMEFVVASWSGPGAGVLNLGLYDAVIVNKTELPFLTIP
jgi:hypothetical protein